MTTKQYVEFHNGNKMPIIGLGSWAAPLEETENALKIAIDLGYRHIDTAYTYRNERGVGNAIKAKIQEGVIKREDVFVTTKLPGIGMRKSDVEKFLRISLFDLQTSYVDLYLIHTPLGFPAQDNLENVFPREADGSMAMDNSTNLEEIWQEMERMVDLGLAKSIGISNFNTMQVQRIVDMARIKPANIQVECHAYLQQKKLRNFCKSKGITVCAYGPIGSPGKPEVDKKRGAPTADIPKLLEDPVVVSTAKKHDRSPAQVLLRFLIQEEVVVIPKSGNPERIKQNFEALSFELDEADMKSLRGLDRNARYFEFNWQENVVNHPEYPFKAPH